MIKSVSCSQEEILQWIIQLYISSGCFDVDATFSTGGFYRNAQIPLPRHRFDLTPQADGVQEADCRNLPLAADSIQSMILDPPFLATKGPSLSAEIGNRINRRFGVYPNETALRDMYADTISEAYRVLKPGGILVFKCQDKVSSGKQHMMHCFVYTEAVKHGFEPLDLFILLAKSRLIANWQRNQKHARKYHCYFWVFRKPKSRKRRDAIENYQPERLHR